MVNKITKGYTKNIDITKAMEIIERQKSDDKIKEAAHDLLEALKVLLKSHEALSFEKTGDITSTKEEQQAINAIKKATE